MVGPPLANAERRGDVLRADLAVPPGVLRGHRRELAGLRQVGHRGHVSAGEQLGAARHLEVRVDEQPSAFHGQPQGLDQRVRPHADAPHERARVDARTVGQHHAVVRGLLHRGPHPHVDAPLPQYPVGGAGEPFVHLGQHPGRHVQQHPAGPHTGAHGVLADLCVGVHRAVRGDLGAGVPGADHDEGAPRGALPAVVGRGGQLHLARHVVAEVQRLRQPTEAVRVLGDARDGQQLVDAARGEHQPVEGQGALAALGPGVVHGVLVEVDAVGLAQHQPDVRQRAREGHGDAARLQDSGGDLRQQRQVEEVVGRVEQGDVGLVPGEPGQGAGRPVPGETGTDDHDAGSAHGSPPGCRVPREPSASP